MLKLIVDFEATCTDKNEFPRHEMEIIEIGAVLFDDNGGVSHYQNWVKPVKNPNLTSFCQELTGITQDDVDWASGFEVVMEHFLSWVRKNTQGEEYVFYSWGAFDKNIMGRQCVEYGIDATDVLNQHVNAKELFAEKFNCKPMGVTSALKLKRLKFEGQHHRALDDAINITKLVKLLEV